MTSETNVGPRRTYLPAAGHDWLLPLYDPVVTLLGGDPTRRVLVEQATIQPSHRVLEVGCGTGSLVLLVKRLHPGVDVVGIDPDPKALARARRKAARAKVSVRFDHGFADEMPYPEASFDRVFSSFMLHHLRGTKRRKRCARSDASSSPPARFTSSISPVPRPGLMVSWLGGSTRVSTYGRTPRIESSRC